MHTVADPQQPAVRQRRRRRGGAIVLLLIVVALAGGIAYPPTFLFAVRQVLGFEAWRYGFQLTIGGMDGSVVDSISLHQVRLSHMSEAGTSTVLDIDDARTNILWRHLFWKRDAGVWRDLAIIGMRGTIDLPSPSEPQTTRRSFFSPHGAARARRPVLPASLSLSHASVVVRHREGSVRFNDIELQTSRLDGGHVVIGALEVHEPWGTSLFSNCRGSLLMEDSKLMLSNMKLADSLTIASASADLPGLLRGELQMQFGLDAFSGNIQGELTSGPHEEHLVFDSSGTFQNISVAQLAAFFGKDADGSIKQGKFTFHGSPRDLAKATFTTRFEAGDFRWGARRWNTLVAGATYVDHRLLIPEFQLRQAHNSLTLQGDMNVPGNWQEWWKTDFSFQVTARIDNLTELSALLGSGFGDIFGKLTVDGSVRGENAAFTGELIVSGSHLSFRKAPLDELQAAIKLDGNEIQVTNAEFTHGDDFMRAHGVVNILGTKRYWGEVKANIADLALYASFLQPPIAPEAFGGGLMLDWSGDGTESAHSGAFSLRLSGIHPLAIKGGDAWQPIDLTADATYSPESIFFSNLVLGNGQTTAAARVVATPRSLTLQDLKLMHGKAVWLAGDAQVPLNVWGAWQNPEGASWWSFDSACKVDLQAKGLSLRDTLFLSGRQQPFDGEITGDFKSDGTLGKLTTEGHLVVKDAAGPLPAGELKGTGATLDFKGSQVTVSSGTGDWNGIAWSGSGTVTASDVRQASLDLSIDAPSAPLKLGDGVKVTSALDLRATGQPDTLVVSGSAQLQSLEVDRAGSVESLVAPGGFGLAASLPALAIGGPDGWKLDIHAGGIGSAHLTNASGKVAPTLEITGSPGRPEISGSLEVEGFTLSEGPDQLTISKGTFLLNSADPERTAMVLHANGVAGGEPFDGYIFGRLMEKHFTWGPRITAELMGEADFSATPPPAWVTGEPLSLDLGAAQAASPFALSVAPPAANPVATPAMSPTP